MKISVIGTGYVGLTSGACLAKIGHQVTCVDNDEEKIAILKKGGIPIYEPGLKEVIEEVVNAGRLSFSTRIEEAVEDCKVCFICVGTPPRESGEPDLSYVERVAEGLGKSINEYLVIVEKSTVPVQTGKWLKRTIASYNLRNVPFDVASNPEFLREGSAVQDFLYPDRIVIGVESERAKEVLLEVYSPIDAPKIVTDIASAELIKHASNAFLAMKISFINAVSFLCEKVGADVCEVAEGIGLDKRIGSAFLNAGVGYGGFCFPKDLRAFIRIAEELGYEFRLLREVERINEEAKHRFVKKIRQALSDETRPFPGNLRNKTIGVLGLAFKPNTDDMRFAPSIDIIKALLSEGAQVRAYDPQAIKKAQPLLPEVEFCASAEEVAEDADLLAIITEWEEFKKLDLSHIKSRMRTPIICDGRNIFKREEVERLGFTYIGVGR